MRVAKGAFGQVLTQKLVQGLSVARACRHMGHSRQAYYKSRHRERQRQQQTCQVVSMVTALRVRQPRLGTRELHTCWASRCGRRDQSRAYNKTTDSHHRCLRHPNLLKAGEGQIGDAHRAPGQFGGGKCGDELWTTARRAEDGQIWPAKSGSYNGVDCPLPKRLRLGRSDTEA